MRAYSQDPHPPQFFFPPKAPQIAQILKKPRILPSSKNDKFCIQNSSFLQPPIFDLIKLSPGVTLTEGDKIKHSPQSINTSLMSRKQYIQRYYSKENQNSTSNVNLKNDSSNNLKTQEFDLKTQEFDEKTQELDGKDNIFDIIPDYENFIVNPQGTGNLNLGILQERPCSYGKVVRYDKGFEGKEILGAYEKFNAEIVTDKNWGMNPLVKGPMIIRRIPKRVMRKKIRDTNRDTESHAKKRSFFREDDDINDCGNKTKKPRERRNAEKMRFKALSFSQVF